MANNTKVTKIGTITDRPEKGACPLNKVNRRCPATILAAKRTDRVIGRIRFLVSSITTIKGIKAIGVPRGTR